MEPPVSDAAPAAPLLPSLDRARQGLRSPPRPRARLMTLVLCALFAAVMGVSVAAVAILGPGGGSDTARTVKLSGR